MSADGPSAELATLSQIQLRLDALLEVMRNQREPALPPEPVVVEVPVPSAVDMGPVVTGLAELARQVANMAERVVAVERAVLAPRRHVVERTNGYPTGSRVEVVDG